VIAGMADHQTIIIEIIRLFSDCQKILYVLGFHFGDISGRQLFRLEIREKWGTCNALTVKYFQFIDKLKGAKRALKEAG
jgi:hypothetical protein